MWPQGWSQKVIFLLEYDRRAAKRVFYEVYDNDSRAVAQGARLEREIAVLKAGVDHEVVLLDAPDEASLKRTHARYFDTSDEMIYRLQSSTEAFAVRETGAQYGDAGAHKREKKP
jgi:hypothetical protein